MTLKFKYEYKKKIDILLQQYNVIIRSKRFTESILLLIELVEDIQTKMIIELKNITKGNITIEVN